MDTPVVKYVIGDMTIELFMIKWDPPHGAYECSVCPDDGVVAEYTVYITNPINEDGQWLGDAVCDAHTDLASVLTCPGIEGMPADVLETIKAINAGEWD